MITKVFKQLYYYSVTCCVDSNCKLKKSKVMLGTNGGNNYTKPNPTVFKTLT